jgi:phosphoglycerate dehydrogenase-like enzyme
MKPGAILINAARREVLDLDVVLSALSSHHRCRALPQTL